MAWTVPTIRATGDIITASIWNGDVVNNFVALSAGARVFHNTTQSITSGTLTALAFNSERYDTDAIHDTVTNNSRLTCKTPGKYDIKGNVEWALQTAGYRDIAIKLNGTTFIAYTTMQPTSVSSGIAIHAVSCHYTLALNDYVELLVLQTTGGALNILSSANYSPEFSMHFVGG